MTRDELPDYTLSDSITEDAVKLQDDYEIPKYRVSLLIQCDQHPKKWILDHIYQYLEPQDDEYANILRIERYEDRPTTVEHHGGYTIPERY